jgi:hypothetical protein
VEFIESGNTSKQYPESDLLLTSNQIGSLNRWKLPHAPWFREPQALQTLRRLAMSDLVDALNPDALIPERVCDAIVSLDGLSSSEVLNLMEAIVAQLQSEVMEANLTQLRSAS